MVIWCLCWMMLCSLHFKNEMHRNTTEKPENKVIIEQVLSSVLGKPMRLLTIMRKEWDDAKNDATSSAPEEMELVAEGR